LKTAFYKIKSLFATSAYVTVNYILYGIIETMVFTMPNWSVKPNKNAAVWAEGNTEYALNIIPKGCFQ
jgi:hypothetical protein